MHLHIQLRPFWYVNYTLHHTRLSWESFKDITSIIRHSFCFFTRFEWVGEDSLSMTLVALKYILLQESNCLKHQEGMIWFYIRKIILEPSFIFVKFSKNGGKKTVKMTFVVALHFSQVFVYNSEFSKNRTTGYFKLTSYIVTCRVIFLLSY